MAVANAVHVYVYDEKGRTLITYSESYIFESYIIGGGR